MVRKLISAIVVAGLLVCAGSALAAEPEDGLPQSVISQWEIAEMAFSLANPVQEEEPADPVDPIEGTEVVEGEEGELEDEPMDPAKAMELAERHAFIGMAHLLGIPASRNIQNDPAWAAIWSSVLEQVATGEVTLSEALAGVVTEENGLLEVSPGLGLALGKTSMETTQLMASLKEKKEKEDKEDKDKSNNGNDKDKDDKTNNGNNDNENNGKGND